MAKKSFWQRSEDYAKKVSNELKLPRFGGHLRIWEKGVHNGKESIFVPA